MDHSNTELPSRIASLVHEHFDGLPTRSKPHIHPDGSREWIPMSGIVIVKGGNTPLEKLTCVTVTTGAKCLSVSQIPKCRGIVLHDCHAEILAIRAFNYWLLNECQGVLTSPTTDNHNGVTSPYIRHRSRSNKWNDSWPPLELYPDIRIYMYCTCAPCGDASMELCMAAQEDPTPWEPTNPEADSHDALFVGRAHFSLLGVVRRKPSRMDAESTRSKSCSDKLALRQVSSLLSYETSLLVAPTDNVYLEGIILPEEEISRVACERAFGAMGRMKRLNGRGWPDRKDNGYYDSNDQKYGYRFRPFQILSIPSGQIELLWPFRKPPKDLPLPPTSCSANAQTSSSPASIKKSKPGNISAIWTIAPSHHSPVPDHNPKSLPKLRGSATGLYETIINGVKQGNRVLAPVARGASALSRARLWALMWDIIVQDQEAFDGDGDNIKIILKGSTYDEFKRLPGTITPSVRARGQAIEDARQALKGWLPNSGDEQWGLDVLTDPKEKLHNSKNSLKKEKKRKEKAECDPKRVKLKESH